MDDLTERLRALNKEITLPDMEPLSLELLQSRMRPDSEKVSFAAARNATLGVVVILLLNISALVWSGSKDTERKAGPANTYMQTYNMSLY